MRTTLLLIALLAAGCGIKKKKQTTEGFTQNQAQSNSITIKLDSTNSAIARSMIEIDRRLSIGDTIK